MRKKHKKTQRPKSALAGVILSTFSENPFRAFNYKQISKHLGLRDQASRDLVFNILEELKLAGELLEEKPGKYKLNAASQTEIANIKKYVTGTVDLKKTGKAYISNDDGGDDIFIAANNVHHALHGDKVKVFIFPRRKGHKKEGQIVEILERKKNNFVGVLELSKNFGFVIPDSDNMPYDIFIPKSQVKGAENGLKVIAKVTEWPEHSNNPFGEIVDVLGKPGDNDVEMQSILAEYNFPLSFPKNVEKEAENIDIRISQSEIKKRKDFRNTWTITIDPFDAKDFDDALSLKKLKDGLWEVGIHIADVSHYVQPKSSIDKEAYSRATSIYLVDRVIPMLPEVLSNNVCSLRPNEDKLTFSAVFKMNDRAEVLEQWFGKTIINSDRRFNYGEVQQVIETEEGEFSKDILQLHLLASVLRKERFANGSINFNSEEIKFRLDENGKPIETFVKEQKESNHLVEEFMLLANKKVAELIGKPKDGKTPKTFVYRIHDEPNPEKLNTFVQFLGKLGLRLNVGSHKQLASSYNELFTKIKGRGEEHMIESIAIRTMAKAIYSTDNIGHYGLAFQYYTHFTSPIRRYPDLMVHRLLELYLNGGNSVKKDSLEDKCQHSSDMEKLASEAERASIKYKQIEYMTDKVGQVLDGSISGVSKWGIFVEIDESKSEGLIRFNELKDDYYYLDEDNYRIIGKSHGNIYRLGDKVRVLVKKVDLGNRQMDLQLMD
ncbi:MAG: ribonuclease R [Bacteroidales bacterium]|jgi:ribonuclease R|nr:ribonuclease R [Bacteroidales bacterium]